MASVDDDFEYYIKFPPSRRTSNVDSEEWSRFTGDENKKLPVIVLLGWAGCQDKYLCKYSAIYEERGLITLRTTAPLQTLFVHRASMSELAAKLVDTLYDMNLHQHPLVFHLFSNGGSYLYGHVLKRGNVRSPAYSNGRFVKAFRPVSGPYGQVRPTDRLLPWRPEFSQELNTRPLQIRGIIFDSSPGRKRFSSLWGALTAILGGPVVAFAAATALALMWTAQNLWYSYVLRREEPYGDPFNPLLGDPQELSGHFYTYIYKTEHRLTNTRLHTTIFIPDSLDSDFTQLMAHFSFPPSIDSDNLKRVLQIYKQLNSWFVSKVLNAWSNVLLLIK
ncbi:hypothetical protein B566_EDAN008269, partial [Ephemera danica]